MHRNSGDRRCRRKCVCFTRKSFVRIADVVYRVALMVVVSPTDLTSIRDEFHFLFAMCASNDSLGILTDGCCSAERDWWLIFIFVRLDIFCMVRFFLSFAELNLWPIDKTCPRQSIFFFYSSFTIACSSCETSKRSRINCAILTSHLVSEWTI